MLLDALRVLLDVLRVLLDVLRVLLDVLRVLLDVLSDFHCGVLSEGNRRSELPANVNLMLPLPLVANAAPKWYHTLT